MPQITLEYTANITRQIDFKVLFHQIHTAIHDIAGVNIENCKSRSRKIDTFYMGDGQADAAFVSFEIYLLEGRTEAIKQALIQAILVLLENAFSLEKELFNLQITAKIGDIAKAFYLKYPAGSFTPQ